MGESMSVDSTGGQVYRCARGGCDTVLAGPHEQDGHNHQKHLNSLMGDAVAARKMGHSFIADQDQAAAESYAGAK